MSVCPITIFTPAYNRAYCLHKCYESLKRQKVKDFVWLIIDDGSDDNTRELVESWKNNNEFEIRYIYKENGGMHTAHNVAYENIDTELNVCIDSDDYLTDDAVEIILDCWNKNKDDKYSGIVALDITQNGEIIGTQLPNQTDIKLYDFYSQGGKGDKKLIYRTDVMKNYPPYPVFEGEKYVGLAYKYLLADQDYFLLVLNKPVCVVEYMPDSSTTNMLSQYRRNPYGFAFFRKVSMQYEKSLKRLFILNIHYVSSSIISKNKSYISESPCKFLTVVAIPFGFLLSIYIKIKTNKK